MFGIPILGLIVGLILVWCGKAEIKARAIVTFSSIPIIAISFLVSIYLRTANAETFLIPQNYRGEIVVFLDEQCGQEPAMENGRRIYNIPPSGILITQFSENDGYLNRKFYLVNEFGDRTEIPLFGRQNFETEEREWSTYGAAI